MSSRNLDAIQPWAPPHLPQSRKDSKNHKAGWNTRSRDGLHSAVQPHGYLLIMCSKTFIINQVSANITDLGFTVEEVLLQKLKTIIGEAAYNTILETELSHASYKAMSGIPIEMGKGDCRSAFTGVFHTRDNVSFLELEPCEAVSKLKMGALVHNVSKQLPGTTTSDHACQLAVEAIQRDTGYDRVMVLKFHEAEHCEVVAEKINEGKGVEVYYRKQWPAQVTPKYTRELFLRNLFTHFPDVRAGEVPLIPENDVDTGRRPDMSMVGIRAVAPCHLTHLTNQGVQSSMCHAIIVDAKLWGLLYCHHLSPLYVPFERRVACQMATEVLAQQVKQLQINDEARERERTRSVRAAILQRLRESNDPVQAFAAGDSGLQSLMDCDGAAAVYNGQVVARGCTPKEDQIRELVEYAINRCCGRLAVTSLAQVYPKAEEVADSAVGCLLEAPSEDVAFMWFRKSVPQQLQWGGVPNVTNINHRPLDLPPSAAKAVAESTPPASWSGPAKEAAQGLARSAARHASRGSEAEADAGGEDGAPSPTAATPEAPRGLSLSQPYVPQELRQQYLVQHTRCSIGLLPDDILSEVFLFENAKRKWRLVNKKFARCVPIHIAVAKALNSKQEHRLYHLLANAHCRSLNVVDWGLDASRVGDRISTSKSLRSVSLHHTGTDAADIVELAFAAMAQDSIETWSFGGLAIGDEGLVALGDLVTHSKRIKSVEFENCTFGDQGMEEFTRALGHSTSLRALAFRACTLSPAETDHITKGLSNAPTLQSLNMAFTPLSDAALEGLSECLEGSSTLKYVNLDFTNIGMRLPLLKRGITASPALSGLSLKGNSLGDGGAECLAEALPGSSVERLNLSDNQITHFGAMALGEALPGASRLQELLLNTNTLAAPGTKALAEGVARAKKLRVLGLSGVGVDAEGGEALARAVEVAPSLESVDLSHNVLQLGTARVLAEAFRKCKTVKHLNFESCHLEPQAMAAVARLATQLLSLNVGCCEAEPEGIEALGQALAESASLQSLTLTHVPISDEGAKTLASGLARSQSLRQFDLQGCGIGAEGVTALAHALAQARQLERLNLRQNHVGEEGAQALAHGIRFARAFQSLDLEYSAVTPQGTEALVQAMQASCTFNDLQLAGSELCVGAGVQTTVTVKAGIHTKNVEVIKNHPFACTRCKHKLYEYNPDLHRVIVYSVDRACIIQEVMTPEEWIRFADLPLDPPVPTPSAVQGQPLTMFMEHRLAGFYHTLCSLVWDGDLCHTQFQWYCDDPDNRREMISFVYRFGNSLLFTNVTVAESPHQVPVSFMAGDVASVLHRCPFCGWSFCNGGDWMEPEEFYMWILTEWPALMRDTDYYPVVCEECLEEWVHKHDNPDLTAALEGLRPPALESAV